MVSSKLCAEQATATRELWYDFGHTFSNTDGEWSGISSVSTAALAAMDNVGGGGGGLMLSGRKRTGVEDER